MSFTAPARIEGSKLNLIDSDAFREGIKSLRNGKVSLTIKPWSERQRSLSQNSYLHAVVFPIAAEWMGQGIAETKLDLMGACFGWKESKLGKLIPERPSTSQCTVDEMTHFIEWVVPFLGSHGVRVPLPREC